MAEHTDCEVFKMRPIQKKEIEEVFNLIDQEQWDLTFSKFKTLAERCDDTVYVFASDGGKIIGTLSIMTTHKGECVLGYLVAAKEFRGTGLGGRILREIQELCAKWTVVLAAVAGSEGFYSKCGFRDTEQNHEVIYIQVKDTDLEQSKICLANDVVKTYSADMFDELCQYDGSHRGYDNSTYLSILTETAPQILVARNRSSNNIVGYVAGFMKVLKGSTVVLDGFFADDDNTALLLYKNILRLYPDRDTVRIETIKPRLFLTRFGKILHEESEVYTKMANGKCTPASTEKLYSITDSCYTV